MPAAYETFLFDLDGTLIDSIELIRNSYAHTLREHLGREADPAEWLEGLGRPLTWQFARHVDSPMEIQAMVTTYRAHNAQHHDAMVSPYPGTLEKLTTLKRRGARLAVVTSKLRSGALRGLVHCKIDGFFDAVVGCDEVREAKPAAEPALLALERLGATPKGAVMIGDSPHDLACGRAAGLCTAAASWGPFPRERLESQAPDHFLSAPSDIAHLAPTARPVPRT